VKKCSYLPVKNQLQEREIDTRWCFFFCRRDEPPAWENTWRNL